MTPYNCNGNSQHPFLGISILRVSACFMIYLHHFIRHYTFDYNFSIVAIGIFVFIAGYLSYPIKKSGNWFYRRILNIFIPYWLMLFPLMLVNHILHYKEISILSLIISFLGGTFFLNDPLFLVSWFITFIIGLYLIVYWVTKAAEPYKVLFLVGLLTIYFSLMSQFRSPLRLLFWEICFFIGYISRFYSVAKVPSKSFGLIVDNSNTRRINTFLFDIGKHTYAFYLTHGFVLLLLMKSGSIHVTLLFVLGLVLSGACAVILNYVSSKIINIFLYRSYPK